MENLSKQELHNLAMNIVGEQLESEGYEFLGINSQFKKDPQFVALKHGKLHFVIVRAIEYPNDPREFDSFALQKIKEHAAKFNAKTFYAGVGLANKTDYEIPLNKDSDFIVNYEGMQEI
ncbi:MAG TPA: Na(+)-translocating NADH-quinone reductase subunit F [Salinimicrobium sp.]|nr:Na(+)-translocating NADH-quinone reductase subunit F [Salinimicrobium sp.]